MLCLSILEILAVLHLLIYLSSNCLLYRASAEPQVGNKRPDFGILA